MICLAQETQNYTDNLLLSGTVRADIKCVLAVHPCKSCSGVVKKHRRLAISTATFLVSSATIRW